MLGVSSINNSSTSIWSYKNLLGERRYVVSKAKVIITIIITSILVSGIWAFVMFKRTESITNKFEAELSNLTATLDALGPMVECYTVTDSYCNYYGNDVTGQTITDSSLQTISVPSSLVGDSYVTNQKEIVGKYFKVNVRPGTPITKDLVIGEMYDATLRDVDIVVNSYVVGMRKGDYVDIRITMPFGEDYIVLSKKRVQDINDDTIKMYLTEEEWNIYQSAMVDYYLHANEGVRIYFTKYIEPAIQNKAEEFYAVSDEVRMAMMRDPNITDKAFVSAQAALRQNIQSILNPFIDESDTLASDGSKIQSGRNTLSNSTMSDWADVHSDQEKAKEEAADEEGVEPYEEEEVVVNFEDAPTVVETLPEETVPVLPTEETFPVEETFPEGEETVAETTSVEETTSFDEIPEETFPEEEGGVVG